MGRAGLRGSVLGAWLGTMLVVGFWGAPSFAEKPAACGADDRPIVQVKSVELKLDTITTTQFIAQLRAELAERGIGLCVGDLAAKRSAVAVIAISPAESGAVAIHIDVRDAVTNKELMRVVDLSSIPRDGHPLALAVATDELLRASWMELAMARHESSEAARRFEPPKEVTETVMVSLAPVEHQPATVLSHGIMGMFELYGGGQNLIGPDFSLGLGWGSRWFLDLRGGYRKGVNVRSVHGTIRSHALTFGLGSQLLLTPPAYPLSLGLSARVQGTHCEFFGQADPNMRNFTRAGLALLAMGGVRAGARLSNRVHAFLDIEGALPIRSVSASDDADRITGISGAGLVSGLGLRGDF